MHRSMKQNGELKMTKEAKMYNWEKMVSSIHSGEKNWTATCRRTKLFDAIHKNNPNVLIT